MGLIGTASLLLLRRRRASVEVRLFLLVLPLLSACGSEHPAAKPPAPRGSTPEAVLEEFNAAVAKADGAALLECLLPEQREHVPILGARAARIAFIVMSGGPDPDEGVVKELDAENWQNE